MCFCHVNYETARSLVKIVSNDNECDMFGLFTGKSAYPWSSYPLRQIWFQVRHARLTVVCCNLLVYWFPLISININSDLILTHPEQCDPLSTIPDRIEIWKCQVLLARGKTGLPGNKRPSEQRKEPARGKTGLPGNKRPSEQRKEPVYGFALCIFCSVKPTWSLSATPCKTPCKIAEGMNYSQP